MFYFENKRSCYYINNCHKSGTLNLRWSKGCQGGYQDLRKLCAKFSPCDFLYNIFFLSARLITIMSISNDQ